MSGPKHAPSDLAGLVHDALVERTSDHAWAEEAAAHLAAVIEAAGWRQVPSARVGTEPRASEVIDVADPSDLRVPSFDRVSHFDFGDAEPAQVPESGARLTEEEREELSTAFRSVAWMEQRPTQGGPEWAAFEVDAVHATKTAVERILAARLADHLSPEQVREPIIRYAETNGAEEFDEFVAHNATIHFEAMGRARWWAGITLPDGRTWHLNFGAVNDRVKFYANCEEG